MQNKKNKQIKINKKTIIKMEEKTKIRKNKRKMMIKIIIIRKRKKKLKIKAQKSLELFLIHKIKISFINKLTKLNNLKWQK